MASEIANGQFDGLVTTLPNINIELRTENTVFEGTELMLRSESNAKIFYITSRTYNPATRKTTTTSSGKWIYANDFIRIGKKQVI